MTLSREHELYYEANRACDAFQAACVRQFGAKKAADKRYMTHEHNAETAAAREYFLLAMQTYRTAMEAVLG